MNVTVHSVLDHYTGAEYVFGFDDFAYQIAMDFMRDKDTRQYEYFGVDDEIDFKWDMTEERYAMMKKLPNEWIADDYIGAVFFGNCKLEFILMQCDSPYVYCNLFVLGQEGYGKLSDGTPYRDYEGFASKIEVYLPKRRTFDAFARHIEKAIVDCLNEYHQLINEALEPTDINKWYPQRKTDSITVTRRA